MHKKKDETNKVKSEEQEPMAEQVIADLDGLKAEVDKFQQDAEEAHNRYLRTLADFDNFRKRQRDETSRLCDYAREGIISSILPILDNFERSVKVAEDQHSYEALAEGVALTLRQLREMLEKEGVLPIEAVGQEFNPEFHEALMRVATEEYPENTVVDELEKGYTLNGKVLRPSRVRVAVTEE